MGEFMPAGARDENGRPKASKLAAAGDEIGVEMGLEAVGQAKAVPLSGTGVRGDVAGRIDHKTSAVAESDEIGRVAESLVDEGDDGDQRTLWMCRSAVPAWRREYHIIPNIVGMNE